MAEDFKPVWAVGLMTGTVLDGNIDPVRQQRMLIPLPRGFV